MILNMWNVMYASIYKLDNVHIIVQLNKWVVEQLETWHVNFVASVSWQIWLCLAGMKSFLPVTPYPSCHGVSLLVIIQAFRGKTNNEQHLSEPCHPIVFCPRLYRDLAMPSCWAHFARGPDMFVCFAQRMTRSWGDEKVVAAPDLTSHPSFCLMPVPQSCDDWETHIFSKVSK